MIILPNKLTGKEIYKLLCGSIVPRPIAWVSTISKEGTPNLAPFSNFMPVSWDPPSLCFSIGPGVDGKITRPKDTLVNINSTKDFVVNIPSYNLANAMFKSGDTYGPDIDEFIEVGLTHENSKIIKSPGVKEAFIKLECKLDRILDVGSNKLIIGNVVCFNISNDVYLENNKINMNVLKPIGRLAGTYTVTDKCFELPIKEN